MRNLSSAPALLAAALATTTLEGCSSLNPLGYAEDAYDWLKGDDSTAEDAAIHYAKTDNPSYPGDFSVGGELEKARAAALKHAEVPITVDEPWYHWADDHPGVVVDSSKFADQCFEMEGAIAPASSAEAEDSSPEAAAAKQAELSQQAEQASRLTRFQKVQDLAETALRSSTIQTLWPVYQSAQNGLGPISNLADFVADISSDDVLCPNQKDYLLDGDKRVPVVAFKVDDQRLALPPDFWSSSLNDCDRAGILAAMEYDGGGREFSTFPETSGKGTDTTNLLQATVTGLCENPNATVAGAASYLDTYYRLGESTYRVESGNIFTPGSAPIKDLDVRGDFYLQPGVRTPCPSTGPIQSIDIDENTTLELKFKSCAPDDSLAATLVEGDKRIDLTPDPTESDDYNWGGVCLKDNGTDCLKWTEYTLDTDTYAWTSKVEKQN